MSFELTDDDVLERSPYLISLKRKRLAPSRLAELLKAVSRSGDRPDPLPTPLTHHIHPGKRTKTTF